MPAACALRRVVIVGSLVLVRCGGGIVDEKGRSRRDGRLGQHHGLLDVAVFEQPLAVDGVEVGKFVGEGVIVVRPAGAGSGSAVSGVGGGVVVAGPLGDLPPTLAINSATVSPPSVWLPAERGSARGGARPDPVSPTGRPNGARWSRLRYRNAPTARRLASGRGSGKPCVRPGGRDREWLKSPSLMSDRPPNLMRRVYRARAIHAALRHSARPRPGRRRFHSCTRSSEPAPAAKCSKSHIVLSYRFAIAISRGSGAAARAHDVRSGGDRAVVGVGQPAVGQRHPGR